MKSNVNVEISEDLVKPIIQAKIQAAIVTEMSKDKDGLLEAMVNGAMTQKVNDDGRRVKDSYYNKTPFIEVLCKNAIQEAAREAMKDFIEENKPLIKEKIKKELTRKNSMMAKAVVDGMVKNMQTSWNFKVDTHFHNAD